MNWFDRLYSVEDIQIYDSIKFNLFWQRKDSLKGWKVVIFKLFHGETFTKNNSHPFHNSRFLVNANSSCFMHHRYHFRNGRDFTEGIVQRCLPTILALQSERNGPLCSEFGGIESWPVAAQEHQRYKEEHESGERAARKWFTDVEKLAWMKKKKN